MIEESLASLLAEWDLADCRSRLTEMGVRKKTDMNYLSDKDFKEAGFNLLEMRKLQYIAEEAEARKAGSAQDELPKKEPLSQIAEESRAAQDEALSDADEEITHSQSGANWARISQDGMYISVAPMDRVSTATRRRHSTFWDQQLHGRPKRLVFVRHGESEGNINRLITRHVPDHMLHLTENGRKQALEAGQRLKTLIGDESLKFTVSPYVRTRETLNGILRAWEGCSPKVPIREDVRIREQEYGNFDDPDIHELHKEKREFGAFYYRFPAGESPADCYDRASLFLESMYRSWNDNRAENQVIICHGMMILVTLMRLLRLPISEFDNLDSLKNCEFVVLERPPEDAKYSIAFTWQSGQPQDFRGLRRKPKTDRAPIPIWDGDPAAPLLANEPKSD